MDRQIYIYVYIYICIYINIYFLALSPRELGNCNISVVVSTSSSEYILVSKYHSPLKGLLGEKADFRARIGKVQHETGRSCCARKQGMLEWWGLVKMIQLRAKD